MTGEGRSFKDYWDAVQVAHRREMAPIDERAVRKALANIDIARARIAQGQESLALVALQQASTELRAVELSVGAIR